MFFHIIDVPYHLFLMIQITIFSLSTNKSSATRMVGCPASEMSAWCMAKKEPRSSFYDLIFLFLKKTSEPGNLGEVENVPE
jgi:hypothetical protein